MIVVEMNPRVSRSSALASKATGFPIAKIAAKLAVGYTLHEIPNDITGETLAAFEPTLDYCVVKIPRWTFEKFPETADTLTTAMKSVGETMAIGRTFREALQKGVRSLEIGRYGLGADGKDFCDSEGNAPTLTEIKQHLANPNSKRLFYLRHALAAGMEIDAIYGLTGIDPWFLDQIRRHSHPGNGARHKRKRRKRPAFGLDGELSAGSQEGQRVFRCSDLPHLDRRGPKKGCGSRATSNYGVRPVYKLVDTCAAEFKAATPYYYSTYEDRERSPSVPPEP
jgi:carbamoyl-phosphate synthase large subunit